VHDSSAIYYGSIKITSGLSKIWGGGGEGGTSWKLLGCVNEGVLSRACALIDYLIG